MFRMMFMGKWFLRCHPFFFDERFQHLRTAEHERLLEHLGKLCARNISKPDAGLWELRNGWQEHTFSNLMCWAGLERLQRVQEGGFLRSLVFNLEDFRGMAERAIRAAVVEGSLRNGPSDHSFDAALLQLAVLRYPDAELTKGTLQRIQAELSLQSDMGSGFLFRYRRKDDFGMPQSAFLICSFWLVQALAKSGEWVEARNVMKDAMSAANDLGLFSEHFLPLEKYQAGNFPQAYSHVGQINAAFSVSPSWAEFL